MLNSMKISLLQNTYSFIEEALSKAISAENDNMHWKFATLNLVQAIELSLKEKLCREHTMLIFQDIDSPKNTVNLSKAINRLQNILKIKFTDADIDVISKASKLRNQIIHFEFELNPKEIKLVFAKLLGFLSHFHTVHLDASLDQSIEANLWQTAINILEYAEELYTRASQIFKEKGFDPLTIWICPHCDMEAFVTQDEINTCYVCGYKADTVICPDCGEVFFLDECHELQTTENDYEYFCIKCYEKRLRDDDSYYSEMMAYFYYK